LGVAAGAVLWFGPFVLEPLPVPVVPAPEPVLVDFALECDPVDGVVDVAAASLADAPVAGVAAADEELADVAGVDVDPLDPVDPVDEVPAVAPVVAPWRSCSALAVAVWAAATSAWYVPSFPVLRSAWALE
jgi:hypothetical protein